ncbi:MAG: ketopantoate reductase family protein, partial [Steroidobacteraceae bacterium]
MRVCIIGCGAIGSLFAAHLARLEDVEVWAYDLDQRHVDAINATGLRLSGVSDLVSRPKATTDAKTIPPCEFGVIATKTLHTRSAMQATAQVFKDGAVCSVQN